MSKFYLLRERCLLLLSSSSSSSSLFAVFLLVCSFLLLLCLFLLLCLRILLLLLNVASHTGLFLEVKQLLEMILMNWYNLLCLNWTYLIHCVVVSSAGMLLTLRDTGVPECVLSGPPQLVRDADTHCDCVLSNIYSLYTDCLFFFFFFFFFFFIEGELSEGHQVIFWATGHDQAVYV